MAAWLDECLTGRPFITGLLRARVRAGAGLGEGEGEGEGPARTPSLSPPPSARVCALTLAGAGPSGAALR